MLAVPSKSWEAGTGNVLAVDQAADEVDKVLDAGDLTVTRACSNLLHPTLKGDLRGSGLTMHRVLSVICDLGRSEAIDDVSQCQAGGHACWQRHVVAEHAAAEPVSPLGLAEQLDVLDAYWRLSFGKRYRLLDLTTATGAASLALPCGSRAEFKSRLSALADIIDKLKVDEAPLPPMTDEERKDKIKGSLDALDTALRHKLPARHQASIDTAIRSLRKIRQPRTSSSTESPQTAA